MRLPVRVDDFIQWGVFHGHVTPVFSPLIWILYGFAISNQQSQGQPKVIDRGKQRRKVISQVVFSLW